MIVRTMAAADAVLAIVDLLSDDMVLFLQPYQNGREHGWSLIFKMRQVAFSEYRNSDSIVVYAGYTGDFSLCGNVPSSAIWEKRNFFRYDATYEAAQFIIGYLMEAENG